MKMISAIVRPEKLENLTNVIREIGSAGITITEVKGYGRQQGHIQTYRGIEYDISYRPKIKIDLAVDDNMVTLINQAILDSAKSGNIGDGKIFVSVLDEVVRIRTADSGTAAL
jgi:nitrogen regulatory protein PII